MDARWERITEVFNAALEREPAERDRFLDDECEGDPSIRAEVNSLLAAHDQAGGFLAQPAAIASGLVASAAADDLKPGATLGAYEIEREIGRGGMGVVYLAEDTRLGRQVAVKVLTPTLGSDATMRARLRREARAAAALSHPAIATVFAFEEIDGRACLVTEFVRGDTLRTELARGPLPPDALIDTGIQVARGLAAAHAAGIVHRDLKPDNVVRNRHGDVKILDFGIARIEDTMDPSGPRLTRAGSVIGTPGYMSPEQLDGSDVDSRSDIFALGVLLYELAAGKHPFEAPTPASAVAKVMEANPPPLSTCGVHLPRDLDGIIRTCLRRHRVDRYASALEVARDLEALRAGKFRPRVPEAADRTRPYTPTWWWRLHQVARMVVEASLVYGIWRVHATVRQDWTLAIVLAYVVTGAINGTLRTHLLFIDAFNPADIDEQLGRTMPFLRATDLIVSVLLLLAAATVARSQVVLPSILAAVSVGWAVTSLVVEPAVAKAAFPVGRTSRLSH